MIHPMTTKNTTKGTCRDTLTWSTNCGQWSLDFSGPLVMTILNLTPDSFSDGGRLVEPDQAVAWALAEEAAGAHIFDLGAESTRPGSVRITEAEEWSRLEPVLSSLVQQSPIPISVDTYRPEVAEKALKAGAAILNDIWAGRYDSQSQMFALAAQFKVPIILMHMLGEPGTMQQNPHYDDVVTEVHDFLLERAQAAQAAGVPQEHIILDPGLGFGKNYNHNLTILNNFDRVIPQGYRSLMALSRKAFLGHILGGAPPDQRDELTAVANAIALTKGADIIRVHQTAPNLAAARLVQALAGTNT